ncbi:hypothetical protein V6N13_039887 [Hibiscus sabdariffa]|uniref:Phytocyanin domain-containing protein n=1 Tax=Hibiscus sabdariffa TaxID=183260 RepID=A0ABR2SUQ3_9ROSI
MASSSFNAQQIILSVCSDLPNMAVFKYDNATAHSVYMLPNLWSYLVCDFSQAKLLSNPAEGGGDGFEFVLNQWRVFYFASGEGNDCEDGLMKLVVVPWPRF